MGAGRGPQTGEYSAWEGLCLPWGFSVETPGGPRWSPGLAASNALFWLCCLGSPGAVPGGRKSPPSSAPLLGSSWHPGQLPAPGIADVKYGSLDTGLAPALGGCACPGPGIAPPWLPGQHQLRICSGAEGGPGPGGLQHTPAFRVWAGSSRVLSLVPVGGSEMECRGRRWPVLRCAALSCLDLGSVYPALAWGWQACSSLSRAWG